MKEVLVYIRNYFRYVNKKILALCTLQTAILVFLNYQYKLEWWLTTRQSLARPDLQGIMFCSQLLLRYLIFIVGFLKKKFPFRINLSSFYWSWRLLFFL